MTYEFTNPDRFVLVPYDDEYDYVVLDHEETTSLIEDGAWDKDEYNKDESYSTSMNFIENNEFTLTIVAESHDHKIDLAVLTSRGKHIRAFVTFNPEEVKGVDFTSADVRIVKGYTGWWATTGNVDPIKITLLTKRELWDSVWKRLPPKGDRTFDF